MKLVKEVQRAQLTPVWWMFVSFVLLIGLPSGIAGVWQLCGTNHPPEVLPEQKAYVNHPTEPLFRDIKITDGNTTLGDCCSDPITIQGYLHVNH